MRVETSPLYGAGIDLLDPQVHVRLIGIPISEENPGARSDWTLYPSWHCIVYASGKRGTGRESVVSEAAKFSWPVFTDADGTLAPPPPGSKFARSSSALAEIKADPATKKRQRRTSLPLRAQVLSLRRRGLVPSAIANALNVSDARVRAVLKQVA